MIKIILFMMMLSTALLSNDLGWSHDYKASVAKAKKSGKILYVLITSDNCRWCRKFEGSTLQDKKILKRLYREFEVVHLSRDRDIIPKAFETTPVPRHYFVDASGKILYNSLGHRGVECFDAFMDNAEDKIKVSK